MVIMNKEYLSHDELQHIEHVNTVLREHLELTEMVVNKTEAMLNVYVPLLHSYVNQIAEIRKVFGIEVSNIVQSTRELKIVVSNTQPLMDFCVQVNKLDALLTPSLLDKLQRIIK